MTDKIKPALTPEEWPWHQVIAARALSGEIESDVAGNAWAIAVNNAALPDSDPRKITRAMVDEIRAAADTLALTPDLFLVTTLRRRAVALESYLPPEA